MVNLEPYVACIPLDHNQGGFVIIWKVENSSPELLSQSKLLPRGEAA